jgi:hypothetical protein
LKEPALVIENILAQLAYAYSHAGNANPVQVALMPMPDNRPAAASGTSLARFIAERRNPNFSSERR